MTVLSNNTSDKRRERVSVLISHFLTLIVLIAVASTLMTLFWGETESSPGFVTEIILQPGLNVADFGEINRLPNPVLKRVFGLHGQSELQRPVSSFGLTETEIIARTRRAVVLNAEKLSKNWTKIRLKFALWFVFLMLMFILLKTARIKRGNRPWFYLIAVILFGVCLGSDPSPMGTIKDMLVLYGRERVIFPPRLVALGIMLVLVLGANKFICSWGCQLGTLQDYLLRLNYAFRKTRLLRLYKPSFKLTNTIRICFFTLVGAAAFAVSVDIVEPIDPFKIFNPFQLGIGGIVFSSLILGLSLFIYRPWCHFFCPFGLVGWLFEKVSIFKIKVDYDRCIACEKCARECPSTVMEAILKRERVIPDCFTCGSCIEACPTQAVRLAYGKRQRPPDHKFI
jgi:NAD-dependent dihydropyrimidine dehydrogenase PreA subunit